MRETFPVWTLFIALFLMLMAIVYHVGEWGVPVIFVAWWVAFYIWSNGQRWH